MGHTEGPDGLLARLSWWFHPRMEEVAVEGLAYLLNRYPVSRGGVDEVLRDAGVDLRTSHQPFETEAADLERRRPDILQKAEDGTERLFIEAKFYAGLTKNQPVPYLKRLPEAGVSALMFLAPSNRMDELWPQLLGRLDKDGLPYRWPPPARDPWPRRVQIEGTEKNLLLTDWTTLMDAMDRRLARNESGLEELRQLRALVNFAESRERKAERPGKELVDQVTARGRKSGWLDTKRLRVTPRGYGYGRYARFGHYYKIGVWLGINMDLYEEYDSTPLWIEWRTKWDLGHGEGWRELVETTLEDEMRQHFKRIGARRWLAVVPKHGKGPNDYAAALDHIANVLDTLADS